MRDELKARRASAELNYIQRITFDFCHRFSSHFIHSEDFLEKICNQFNLTREEGIQLVNLNPTKPEDVGLVVDENVNAEARKRLVEFFSAHRNTFAAEIGEAASKPGMEEFPQPEVAPEEYPDEEPTDTKSDDAE